MKTTKNYEKTITILVDVKNDYEVSRFDGYDMIETNAQDLENCLNCFEVFDAKKYDTLFFLENPNTTFEVFNFITYEVVDDEVVNYQVIPFITKKFEKTASWKMHQHQFSKN